MENLIKTKKLKKYFPIRGGFFSRTTDFVKAVDGVDLYIGVKESVGLVGESGCGKTTLARTIMRLLDPDGGEVYFQGEDIAKIKQRELKELRRNMQLVFQDPVSSLNPRMSIENIIGEPLAVHNMEKGMARRKRVLESLESVGLKPEHLKRYPHEFSGGQKQRISIARALITRPKFLVLDEPTSALDVSVQATILNLLEGFQEKLGLTYLFISHDLNMIQHVSDRIYVMYLGKIVESGKVDTLYNTKEFHHPYTEALLAAKPVMFPDKDRKKNILRGEVPSPINPPSGCRFHTRCQYVKESCSREEPVLVDFGNEHYVSCHNEN